MIAAKFSLSRLTLGWLLKEIYSHKALTPAWTFKGGTCLKKCYFETYRFSEDLDFTLSDPAHLDQDFLKRAFSEVCEILYEDVGLQVPAEQLRFDVYRNSRGGLCSEGRLYYEGPLQRARSLPRIKLDLTVDELLVLPAVDRPVGHPYGDLPEGGMSARCYVYEEVFGEKVRALAERTRPRDLYDVVNLFRHDEFRPDAATVLGVLQKKCAFKGIAVPTFQTIVGSVDELIADWANMLGHQLPKLPPFESFWSVMPEFFSWLASGIAAPSMPIAPIATDEQLFRPAVGAVTPSRRSWFFIVGINSFRRGKQALRRSALPRKRKTHRAVLPAQDARRCDSAIRDSDGRRRITDLSPRSNRRRHNNR